VAGSAQFSATLKPETLYNVYFKRCGPGWHGGDSTFSVELSKAEVAWFFSDSGIIS